MEQTGELDQCFKIRCSATALEHQKVKRGRIATGQNGQTGMSLPAMMGLVVKQMQQDIPEDL